MTPRPTPDEISVLYRAGVDSVSAITSGLTPDQWATTVCGEWSATETVRHLVAVAGWYHQWLDRAIAGELSRPFPGDDIDAHNTRAVAEFDDLTAEDAVVVFVELANAYLDRALLHWDRPYSYPFGTVTVGLHAGVAATEWHLHAWDLSALHAPRHVPESPDRLMIAAGLCVADAEGGVRGALLKRLVPLAARRAPWERLLARTGRT